VCVFWRILGRRNYEKKMEEQTSNVEKCVREKNGKGISPRILNFITKDFSSPKENRVVLLVVLVGWWYWRKQNL
jgi:hypothetical protein